MNIAILGAGMVGSAMAKDLSSHFDVCSFDINQEALNTLSASGFKIKTKKADLQDYQNYPAMLEGFDLIVSAVPGYMGFNTLKAIINSGKDCADISFFPENALDLDSLAKEKQVTVITDIGVAPGMSNLIIGFYDQQITINSFEIYVGGLPKVRKKPFEYKAPFSPIDVIEEYTRPARLFEHGRIIVKQALSEKELIEFDGLGTLEAFNTDGLRSLLFTMSHIKDQKEKTLRYPGHSELIIGLQQAGFFSEEPMKFGNEMFRPIDITSKILFKEWKLAPGDEELTVMKVILHGTEDGNPKKIEYNLLDRYDTTSGISSMSRSTGYTCTAAANLIAQKIFTKKGVYPPELIASTAGCFQFVMDYLKARGVNWIKNN
ncbi:MAG: saccharopine dehydrogenase [Chitinophagaceae bacterium]|nr:MAG: saccharopine dehydrogenase [Chitinophagaceae bacterium]